MSRFNINTNIYWGRDRYKQLFDFLASESIVKVAFIIDKSLSSSPALESVIEKFVNNKFQIETIQYIKLNGEPSYSFLDKSVKDFRNLDVDLIVAIGGGSLMDLAKGIAILMKNPKDGLSYRGFNKVENQGIPLCAFPTTAGTGSEVTWTASFVDTKEGKKLGINGRYVAPICGVLEPELLVTCPNSIMISAGLDALVHSVEAITAKSNNSITRYIGEKAFSLVFNNLSQSIADPLNLELKERLLLGAYLAGVAMMNAGGGPASGVSYPIGVYYKVPHGIAGGVFLGNIFKQNIEKGYQGYRPLIKELTGLGNEYSSIELNTMFLKIYDDFFSEIGGPTNLNEWGIVNEKQINHIVKLTMEQRLENLMLNPLPYGEDDLRYLLNTTLLNDN